MLLEAAESCYSPALTNIQQDVLAGKVKNMSERSYMLECSTCVCNFVWIWAPRHHLHLASIGRGQRHLHLLEAPAVSVWGDGECWVSWCQGSHWPFDAHSVSGLGKLPVLQHPSTPHCSAAGDLQPPHTTGQLHWLLSAKWQSSPNSCIFCTFLAKQSCLCTIYELNLSDITCRFMEVFIVKCAVKS